MRALRTGKFRVLAVLAMLAMAAPPAHAETVVNDSVDVTLFVFVPCANGGAGELIAVSGPLHEVININFDNSGGAHVKLHFQPQGISGVGLTTGDKYQATGLTQDQFNAKVGYEETFINRFDMVGQGPGNNFSVHETFHITINPDGTVTSFHDNVTETCN